ncbi:sigma-54-dependent Fis family transcriptional regulator [Solidesulfovibrio sp.]|uniref:sigma-54-dependent Fis family transcriptional regulator n=1 Tax=Solidesulfovibrio sp. TaxID=2910990 RepID=UPI0026385416|nr:sigma-54-dependent Fis family transcriptional regulator [Solidesulfovibrio sp.]
MENINLRSLEVQQQVIRRLNDAVLGAVSRKGYFKVLSHELRRLFPHDRLAINLYDSDVEILTYFTTADGVVVGAQSSVRQASPQTVAGLAITSREPVVIRDLARQFKCQEDNPLAEAGLQASIAFPLIVRDAVLGTLHCSFRQEPPNLMDIVDFIATLTPFVSSGVDAILTRERLSMLGAGPQAVPPPPDLIEGPVFESAAMKAIMQQIRRVAPLEIPILIQGETGTGKTMIARYIHEQSRRAKFNFVKVNCPALVTTLFESELFGHAKGAFTGATSLRQGRIEMANKGTLFLDEIGELHLDLQSKLLQVLEENSFERVGESIPFKADIRLVAATNIDLVKSLREGRLRSDLYYRLATMIITIPPLRERREDIPVLVKRISGILSASMRVPDISLTMGIMRQLQEYNWPGNIRELRNLVSRMLIANAHRPLTLRDVQELLGGAPLALQESPASFPTLRQMEKRHIEKALSLAKGRVSGPESAAGLLGIPRTTLQYRMRKLGIAAPVKD